MKYIDISQTIAAGIIAARNRRCRQRSRSPAPLPRTLVNKAPAPPENLYALTLPLLETSPKPGFDALISETLLDHLIGLCDELKLVPVIGSDFHQINKGLNPEDLKAIDKTLKKRVEEWVRKDAMNIT